MEGNNVYLCKWKKTGRLFKLWLDGQPNVAVVDADFDNASDALAEKVADFYHDQEAVLEFDPPEPSLPGAESSEILILGYNEFVDAANLAADMFVGGLCSKCNKPLGERTGKPLIVSRVPKNDVAGVGNWAPDIFLFSDKFAHLITPEEKSNLRLMEVLSEAGAERKFFEVTGTPIARFVGVKGATYSPLSCWRCSACGASRIYPRMPPGKMYRYHRFVCSKDLPHPVPTIFTLGGQGMSFTPCILKDRWRQIVGKPGAKGITTSPIGVVEEDLADYNPPLPVYKK